MRLANYTTTVSVQRSVALTQEMLAAAGARAVSVEYAPDEPFPCALSFRFGEGGEQMGFRIPVDWRATLKVLNSIKGVKLKSKGNEQAKRVAWRCLHDLIRAQVALREIGNAAFVQSMLGYGIAPDGRSVRDILVDSEAIRENLLNFPNP